MDGEGRRGEGGERENVICVLSVRDPPPPQQEIPTQYLNGPFKNLSSLSSNFDFSFETYSLWLQCSLFPSGCCYWCTVVVCVIVFLLCNSFSPITAFITLTAKLTSV